MLRLSIEVWADGVRWRREMAFCSDCRVYVRASQIDMDEVGRWNWEGGLWSGKVESLRELARAATRKGWEAIWAHPGLEGEAGAELVKTVAWSQ